MEPEILSGIFFVGLLEKATWTVVEIGETIT
jgi:hypothetical protein